MAKVTDKTKAARDAKAATEWDEIESSGLSVKALVDNETLATNKKKAQANKANKKAKKKAQAAMRKAADAQIQSSKKAEVLVQQYEKQVEVEAKEHDKNLEVKMEIASRLDALSNTMREALAAPGIIDRKAQQALWNEAKAISALSKKLDMLDQPAIHNQLAVVYQEIEEVRKANFEMKKAQDIEDVTPKKKKKEKKYTSKNRHDFDEDDDGKIWRGAKDFFDRSRDEKGVIGIRKSAGTALAMVGAGAKNKVGQWKGNLGKAGLATYSKAVNKLIDAAGSSPIAVKAITKLDKGLRFTGNAVKEVGTESVKWLGKKLGSLTGSLMRFIKAPFRAVGGIGNLLGLAALGTMVVGPLLKGVHEELQKQFGENYVEDFIKGLWSKAWSALSDMVKDFLGLKTEKTKTEAEKGRDVANAKLREVASNPDTPKAKELDTRLEAYTAQKKVADEATGPMGKQRANAKAMQFRTRLQNFITDEAENGSISKEKAAQLEKEGIKVPAVKIATSSTSSTKVSVKTSVSGGASAETSQGQGAAPPTQGTNTATPVTPAASAPASPMASAVPKSTTSTPPAGSGGTVTTAVPSMAPMDGAAAKTSGPVTAKPNASSQSESSVIPTPGNSGSSATPGVRSVPTFVGSDSLTLFNAGMLTA